MVTENLTKKEFPTKKKFIEFPNMEVLFFKIKDFVTFNQISEIAWNKSEKYYSKPQRGLFAITTQEFNEFKNKLKEDNLTYPEWCTRSIRKYNKGEYRCQK